MSIKRFYPAQVEQLKSTIPASEYVEHELFYGSSPFHPASSLMKFARQGLVFLIKGISRFLNEDLLIENKQHELFMFKKTTRNLLTQLLKDKKIVRWECGANNFDEPRHYVCGVTVGDVATKDNRIICRSGFLQGYGVSVDIDEAMIIALAEAVERIAGTEWIEGNLTAASVSDLEKMQKQHLAHSYIQPLSSDEREESILWESGTNLKNQSSVLIPASMLYIFYPWHYPQEPVFVDVTSNGAGAHITKQKALLGALSELFERDGFLMYWLNTLSPQRIDIDTINIDEETTVVLKNLQAKQFSLYFLDCKTEYNIPTIVLVCIDDRSGAVAINAAAGLDVKVLIKKVLADTLKWNTDYRPSKPVISYEKLITMKQREELWYSGAMRKHINFFIDGPMISYQEYKSQFSDYTSKDDALAYMQKKLKSCDSDAYYFEYKNELASEVGLSVVKVIVPDLIPMYFVEAKRHCNIKRIYTFAKTMGLSNTEVALSDLNRIPHPFI